MDFPPKIEQWLSQDYFPQRCLFSGGNDMLALAIELAARVNQYSATSISQGSVSDVMVLRDNGERFKIGDAQNPDQNSARGLIRWISQKPIAKHRIVILENFERASREAPQTLLKVLEEPPGKALFLFTTQNHHQILPTIISRMTVVTIPQNYDEFTIDTEVKDFFQTGMLVSKLKKINALDLQIKKEGSKKILHDFISKLLLHSRYFPQYQEHLDNIFIADQLIKKNINHRLVLEQLALKLSN